MKIGNILSGTGYHQLPAGTTAQRPVSPVTGMLRYNTTLGGWDSYDGAGWDTFAYSSLTGADGVASEPMHFTYDTTRAKFLSTATMNQYYLQSSVATDDYINWESIFTSDVGTVVPYNGTVIGFSVYLTDVNLVTRSVSVYVGATESTLQFTIGNAGGTSDGVYTGTKTNVNLNFAAGNFLRVRMRHVAGTASRAWINMNLIMYYKWRI